MTATFVQANGDSNSASSFTLSMLSGNIAAGNQVYVFMRYAAAMTLTAITLPGSEVPTLVDSKVDASGNTVALYRTQSATGGGTDLNLTFNASGVAQYSMAEYSNAGNVIAYSVFVNNASSTSQNAPSGTATASGQLAVSFCSIESAAAMSPGNGETERMDQGRLQIEEKATSGAGSVNNVVTMSGSVLATLSQVILDSLATSRQTLMLVGVGS
jgi:hypothetical protein